MSNLIEHTPIVHNGIFIYQLDQTKDYLNFFEKADYIMNENSYVGTNLNILQSMNKNLVSEIYNTTSDLIHNVLFMNCKFNIYKSWLTKTVPKGNSNSHSHSNSWLSGVFYPEQNKNFNIIFYNDIMNCFYQQPNKISIYNMREYTITPKRNQLILFFSNLRHKINDNNSQKDRYSLAFNLLPEGTFGEGDSKINLNHV
tara:strand:- start:69 stop:665 length:597 start_codon:yes stop_codon:yes gene_type:complete